jgi:hypothetical protein
VYYTSCHDVLCGFFKQVEQSKPGGKLEDTAEGTKDVVTLENQLARCQEENESLCHQIKQVEAAHHVS